MQFETPQFIEIEDKIFGPLTLKQFIYLVGGGGICFTLWKLFPSFLAFLVIPIIAGLSLALAFYKVDNRPFITVIESFLKYITKEKLYIWRKVENENVEEKKVEEKDVISQLYVPRLSDSKLKDIAWSLDVQEKMDFIKKK